MFSFLFFFSSEKGKIILKFVWKCKRPQTDKAILRQKNKAGSIILTDSKLYYKAIVSIIVQYWHKNRHTGQWNRIESPEISPCTFGQLNHDEGDKTIQRTRDNLFNKWCWEKGTASCKRKKTAPLSSTIHQNRLKMN